MRLQRELLVSKCNNLKDLLCYLEKIDSIQVNRRDAVNDASLDYNSNDDYKGSNAYNRSNVNRNNNNNRENYETREFRRSNNRTDPTLVNMFDLSVKSAIWTCVTIFSSKGNYGN